MMKDMITVHKKTDLSLTAKVVDAPYGNLSYKWESEIISGDNLPLDFSPDNTEKVLLSIPPVTETTVYKVILTVTDTSPSGCTNSILGRTSLYC